MVKDTSRKNYHNYPFLILKSLIASNQLNMYSTYTILKLPYSLKLLMNNHVFITSKCTILRANKALA